MDLEKQELRKKHRRARKMMLLFSLLSITMTFAGLTSAYIVSKARPDWLTDFQLPNYFFISTVIIIISSLSMWLAKINVKKNNFSKTSLWLGVTFLLSLFFIFSQFAGYQELINDDFELCGILEADGIHLGKDDITIEEVRDKLGDKIIVGASCYNDAKRVNEMMASSCDYIALGACFPTKTKPNAPRASLNFLEHVVETSIKPVVAIGGINLDNCIPVINSGVDAIAMINALYSTDKDPDKILEIKRKFRND